MKHMLLYRWSNCCESSVSSTLYGMGYHIDSLTGSMSDYDNDENMKAAFFSYFQQCEEAHFECSFVFSIDYFPLISNICDSRNVIYISWFVDYPMNTMYSKSIFNKCNRIFAFDKMQYDELVNIGVSNCFHMPLATDSTQWDSLNITNEDKDTYLSDISFVGTLYNDGIANKYNEIHTLPEFIKGYYDGIIDAQMNVYGYNFIESMLTDTIMNETKKYLKLDLGPLYLDNYEKLLADIINRQVSMLERKKVLNLLGDTYDIDLYTSSNTIDITGKKVHFKGYVDYSTVMPKIFKFSKINLNITSKSITSGIPLRVLDIMGVGGFVISNYQQELAECFENGIEVVMYESMEDLQQKVAYYLVHTEERERIAMAGYHKVKKMFSYEVKLSEILELSR